LAGRVDAASRWLSTGETFGGDTARSEREPRRVKEPPPTSSATLAPGLRELAEAQQWVLGRAQLRLFGVDEGAIRAHQRARRWRVVGRAVVLHRGPLTRPQRAWVAVAQAGDVGALAARSALEVDGLRGWECDDVHVVVPRGRWVCRVPRLVVHESRRFVPTEDVARVPWGPRRTSVGRSAIDAAAWSRHPRTAGGLLAAVVQQGLATPAELADALDQVGRVRHCRLLRGVIGDLSGGAQSMAEIEMTKLVRRAGLPLPRRQVRRRDASGGTRYLDLEVDLPDGTVLCIEVDGGFHTEVRNWWADQRRHNQLARPGTVTLRFPTLTIRVAPEEVLADLVRTRRQHAP
jgi:hypothetical protein